MMAIQIPDLSLLQVHWRADFSPEFESKNTPHNWHLAPHDSTETVLEGPEAKAWALGLASAVWGQARLKRMIQLVDGYEVHRLGQLNAVSKMCIHAWTGNMNSGNQASKRPNLSNGTGKWSRSILVLPRMKQWCLWALINSVEHSHLEIRVTPEKGILSKWELEDVHTLQA
jgi:hypothetical protein